MSYYPYPPQFPTPHYALATVPQDSVAPITPDNVRLIIVQQGQEALVVSESKERGRKPVDPPVAIQLTVTNDTNRHYMQNPYLMMYCQYCDEEGNPEGKDDNGLAPLIGVITSSIARVKTQENKDEGFFIFPDVSIRKQGKFRLQFSLFERQKTSDNVIFLGSILSNPIEGLLARDFKGIKESTALSKALADQGIRIRLRKEPRGFSAGCKRGREEFQSPQQFPQQVSQQSYQDVKNEEPDSLPKRRRTEDENDDNIDPVLTARYAGTGTYSQAGYGDPSLTNGFVQAPQRVYPSQALPYHPSTQPAPTTQLQHQMQAYNSQSGHYAHLDGLQHLSGSSMGHYGTSHPSSYSQPQHYPHQSARSQPVSYGSQSQLPQLSNHFQGNNDPSMGTLVDHTTLPH